MHPRQSLLYDLKTTHKSTNKLKICRGIQLYICTFEYKEFSVRSQQCYDILYKLSCISGSPYVFCIKLEKNVFLPIGRKLGLTECAPWPIEPFWWRLKQAVLSMSPSISMWKCSISVNPRVFAVWAVSCCTYFTKHKAYVAVLLDSMHRYGQHAYNPSSRGGPDQLTLHSQYNGCWWHDDGSIQSIDSHCSCMVSENIDISAPEDLIFNVSTMFQVGLEPPGNNPAPWTNIDIWWPINQKQKQWQCEWHCSCLNIGGWGQNDLAI